MTNTRSAASDFTYMNTLNITIARQPFDHMVYHFAKVRVIVLVLTT